MSDVPPPSLLITPDKRRRLQQRYEEAGRLSARQPADRAAVHEILAECVRDDPGSTLYLDALLANLRQWQPKRSWLSGWFGGAKADAVPGTQNSVLCNAPSLLRDRLGDATVLRQLAEAAAACDLDDIELRYLNEARRIAPDDTTTLRQLARCLTRQGRFEEAIEPWHLILRLDADAEATAAAADLEPAARAAKSLNDETPPETESLLSTARQLAAEGRFAAAEQCLGRAQQASGGDLALLAEREDLRLEHSQQRLEIARRRALSDPHSKAQTLVGRMDQEHNRLEIDIFHLRSERHPHDQRLKLELARRLKRAGNYSGAIGRLEEALSDNSMAAEVNLELGECWQHLRQFNKALGYYRQAAQHQALTTGQGAPPIDARSPITPTTGRGFEDAARQGTFEEDHRPALLAALYRIGVLAAAMNQPAEAKAALMRLVAMEPGYKDARERLDKLP